jgi:two-component system sensor histidine kinase UhpB
MKTRLSFSLKLALIFLVFGIAWIFLTDFIFMQLSNDLKLFYRIQNFKGILFVVISALLIYWVSRELNANIDKANKEQEEALLRFNILGMATKDAVWDYNIKTGESYTNRTLQEIFGYTENELKDNYLWWSKGLHPGDKERVVQKLTSMLQEGGSVWQDEYRFRCKDGSYKTVFDRGYILRDKNGEPYRLIGAMQDVTDQKMLQQQIGEENLRHKNELAQAIISAEEAERKKLGEELHDNINQMLGVAKLYVEHLRANPHLHEELLPKISDHMMQVIEGVRDMSGALLPPLRDQRLLEVISSLIDTIHGAKNINIELKADEFNEDLLSDNKKIMIYRIVQEQLNNVLKHSGADHVVIELKNAGNVVNLSIGDNGEGFDIRSNRPGVGFNNIRNRVEVFNGNMKVNAAPGKGCVVEVEFEA